MKWLGKNGVVEGGSSFEDVIINAVLGFADYSRNHEFTKRGVSGHLYTYIPTLGGVTYGMCVSRRLDVQY
jgi:hypothetical protein